MPAVIILGVVTVAVLVLVWRLSETDTKSIPELFNQQVVSVELIEFEYGSNPETVNRTTVTSPELIQEISRRFDEMPVKPFKEDLGVLTGNTATVRSFHFADGSRIDTLSVLIESHFVVDFWPDRTITHSTWGRPLEGYYDELGTVEEVPGTEIRAF